MQRETAFFYIGDTPVNGDLILAPMDGFSDLPFRSLCREFGSAISYTAFVNAIDILQDSDAAWQALRYMEHERPVVFQIYDSDEERLIQAARAIRSLEPDAIDVNMGCSVRSVSGRGAGAGLLREPDKIERILGGLVSELDLPITAKIRLGWEDPDRNYMQVAQAIERAGASLLAVHARTRQQGFRGEADWDAIAEIKSSISIPVIGNGDVQTPDDARRLLAHTSCDGVMIGRAAMGNPWIFRYQALENVSIDELSVVVGTHLARMLDFHGYEEGLTRFRKHLKRYLAPLGVSPQTLTPILRSETLEELDGLLQAIGIDLPQETRVTSGLAATHATMPIPS
jgi:nifR3 family TIM-barrel protein